MSEINIYCDEVHWGEVLPNVSLIQAINVIRSPYKAANKVFMNEGMFGLSFYNDPSFAFSVVPIKDSLFEIPDENWDTVLDLVGEKKLRREVKVQQTIHKELVGDVSDVGLLYSKLVKKGYTQDIHGTVGSYLCHIMACFIEENKHKIKKVYRRI